MIHPDAKKTALAQRLAQAFHGVAGPCASAQSSAHVLQEMQTPVKPEVRIISKYVPPKKSIYNQQIPFVMVDIAYDTPTRGDTHGLIGVATRLAKKIGAKLSIVDDEDLRKLYPEVKEDDHSYSETAGAKRCKKYFKDAGYPDFFFSRVLDGKVDALYRNGKGIIVNTINESLASALIPDYSAKGYPIVVMPHHLTPETLAFEGRRFAEEYAELPRPFIGINLVSGETRQLTAKLGELAAAYEEATFFVVSCHRTEEDVYKNFMQSLQNEFKELADRFPVVDFNFNSNAVNYGRDAYWNPYKGMLDQADHIIQAGYSGSMLSEALATGKSVYMAASGENYWNIPAGEHVRFLYNHPAGEPLQTGKVKPIDITGECVDHLVAHFARHVEVRKKPAVLKKARKTYNADYKHINPYMRF